MAALTAADREELHQTLHEHADARAASTDDPTWRLLAAVLALTGTPDAQTTEDGWRVVASVLTPHEAVQP
ncbi:hypothetical protein R6L23_22480 [Streptomyces sp. SR27]|uniref:hypothetical protein n=1 Tax=Streptomyces sp. SR27 TaxID=3076630 RepID=UPI00295B8C11|nr:hypothetical protein [Streptomyces sp. SR27]MDV9190944.1 hypothetical protein [Streptomyces sp. SR27]